MPNKHERANEFVLNHLDNMIEDIQGAYFQPLRTPPYSNLGHKERFPLTGGNRDADWEFTYIERAGGDDYPMWYVGLRFYDHLEEEGYREYRVSILEVSLTMLPLLYQALVEAAKVTGDDS